MPSESDQIVLERIAELRTEIDFLESTQCGRCIQWKNDCKDELISCHSPGCDNFTRQEISPEIVERKKADIERLLKRDEV